MARELAMQVASMNPESVDDLLEQDYIRDPKRKINEIIKELAGKVGENIQVGQIKLLEIYFLGLKFIVGTDC